MTGMPQRRMGAWVVGASIIGTVLKQHEPIGNYINQFGPFCAMLE